MHHNLSRDMRGRESIFSFCRVRVRIIARLFPTSRKFLNLSVDHWRHIMRIIDFNEEIKRFCTLVYDNCNNCESVNI